jgi:hypothetical protein
MRPEFFVCLCKRFPKSFIHEIELLRIHELSCLNNYTIGQLNPFSFGHQDPENVDGKEMRR